MNYINVNNILDLVVWLAAAMMLLAFVPWVVNTGIFAYLRNKTGCRNDERRANLFKKQEDTIRRL